MEERLLARIRERVDGDVAMVIVTTFTVAMISVTLVIVTTFIVTMIYVAMVIVTTFTVATITVAMVIIPIATESFFSVFLGRSVVDNAGSARVRDLRVTGHAP